MKSLTITSVWILLSINLFAQSADSLRLKQILLQTAIVNAENALKNAQNAPITAEKTALDNAKKDELTNAKSVKELLGATLPTPLTGGITFSKNDNAPAETKVLIYKNLEKLIDRYIKEIESNKCIPIKCSTDKNAKQSIIVYNAVLYNSLPDYNTLIDEMNLILKSYQSQIDKVSNSGAQSPLASISIGNEVLKTLINVSTMFRAETDFRTNDETIDESTLISMMRAKDGCCTREYYYPSIMSIPRSEKSPLLSIIFKLDSLKTDLQGKIDKYKEENNEPLLEQKKELTTQKTEKEKKISTARATEKVKLQEEIADLAKKIAEIDKEISLTGKEFDDNKAKADAVYDRLREGIFQIDSTSKSTLLKLLLKTEGLLGKLRQNAYTLRITAKGKGTNKVKKFLWGTTLKHSGFVEMEYQLFDANAVLIQANTFYEYSPYTKTKDIK
ncbi:MAG: hypothetical protein EAZ32_19235 [Cytophagia bacterium]|nr:MAG: hypothetical protein EAZ46_11320 [Runella sp.]TAG16749.1 MAG: hypothetical protein EAZ38_18435 [Cytophagales bacterium]TAG34753.1 MAG: hypothetical protein EAZ32_19235 [Cytophagia bacterium]TAG76626.1 MAG: hypothetical protein EAZ22_17585 [Cytophagales bacterium]